MGTRSLTVLLDEHSTEIAVLYRQYDGYPTGHGSELTNFLSEFEAGQLHANGSNCLAARIVAHFKSEAGNFYLYPAGTRDCGEEYVYTVYFEVGRHRLRLVAGCVTYFGLPGTAQKNMSVLFDGFVNEFDASRIEQAWQARSNDPPNDFLSGHAQ